MSSSRSIRSRIQAERAVKRTHMPMFKYPDIVEINDGPSVSERENALRQLFAGPFTLNVQLLKRIAAVLVDQHFKFDASIVRFELTNASTYFGSTNVELDKNAVARFITKISRARCQNFVCVAATLAHEFIHIEINLRSRVPSDWDPSHGEKFMQRKAEFEELYPFLGDLVKC